MKDLSCSDCKTYGINKEEPSLSIIVTEDQISKRILNVGKKSIYLIDTKLERNFFGNPKVVKSRWCVAFDMGGWGAYTWKEPSNAIYIPKVSKEVDKPKIKNAIEYLKSCALSECGDCSGITHYMNEMVD